MDKVSDYIKVYNSMSKNECNNLIDILNKETWEKHTWYNKSSEKFTTNETKELDVFYGNENTHSFVKEHVFDCIEKYCNEFMN